MRDGLRWGGWFIPGDVVSVHTLSLLLSSWVAHDRATEHNHTQQTDKVSYTLLQSTLTVGTVQL